MNTSDLYACNPRQVKKFMGRALFAGVVPYISGQPGIGKSQIVQEVAKAANLEFIDLRLSMCDPTDLMGIPHVENNKAYWVPFNAFPTENTPIPQGKNGWLLMLDELSSANKSIQAASYKLILDRMVGQCKLHPRCYIVAAGNRTEDRAVANRLSTALMSRMLQIHMTVSFDDWLKDVALKRNLDYRIIAFLNMYPDKLNTFDPESDNDTYASPRTWEFLSWIIKDQTLDDADLPMIAGLIDPGVAAEFLQFTKVFNKIVSYEEIVKNPDNALAKTDKNDVELLYATTASIMQKIKKEDLIPVIKYISNLPQAFKLLACKGIFHQHNDFLIEPPARTLIGEISESLK